MDLLFIKILQFVFCPGSMDLVLMDSELEGGGGKIKSALFKTNLQVLHDDSSNFVFYSTV